MAIVCNDIAPVVTAVMPSNCATFIQNETYPSSCGAGTASSSCSISISGGIPPYTTTFSYPQTPATVNGCTLNMSAFTGGSGTNPQFGFAFNASDLCNLRIYGVLQVAYTVTDSLGQRITGNAQYNVDIYRYGRPPAGVSGGGGGGGTGCVSVNSNIFGKGNAGEVELGDYLLLTDPYNNTNDYGHVVYSNRSYQPIVTITTMSGAKLTCSHSAPIPTQDNGYMNAIDIINQKIAVASVHTLEDEEYDYIWDEVVSVEDLGMDWVQHISVDDNCFWASDDEELFILHHNKSSDDVQQQEK